MRSNICKIPNASFLPDGELWSGRVPKIYKSMNNASDMTYFTVYLWMFLPTHAYRKTYTHKHMCTHIFTHGQMQTCTHTLVPTHTYTHTQYRSLKQARGPHLLNAPSCVYKMFIDKNYFSSLCWHHIKKTKQHKV